MVRLIQPYPVQRLDGTWYWCDPKTGKECPEQSKVTNMITAKEAKELYDQSGTEVDRYLKYTVEPEVMKAAKAGKREVIIDLGAADPYVSIFSLITPLQSAVVTKLLELGYHAIVESYGDPYVPCGLADDDGNGPKHRNFGIKIRW